MLIGVIALCNLVLLITATMLCLCWRRKTQKNDLLGLDGLVTQKNPDENVNHLPSPVAQAATDGIVKASIDFTTTATDCIKSSQPVVVNNPRRSLPDIPSDGVRSNGDPVAYEPNGDNSSDLYATVEPYQNTTKRHTLPNGLDSRPSISHHSSISQADDAISPYAQVKEHPYAKVKNEHPYARVQPSSSQEQDENSSGEATPRTAALRNEHVSGQNVGELAAPLRLRTLSGEAPLITDIPAATAVAGGIAANQELPYMTPPIAQTNFSGDSQDSSKGYTSISVREPLANIRAQTKVACRMQGDLDPHYSTVSDDSDEMYTTIQEPNSAIYTSGSETYAQIQPTQLTVAVEINAVHPPIENTHRDEELPHAPQPPSVDSLKHVTHSHSRQASSSSSVGNLGSPKPEKRQANSPLPPPPPMAANPELSDVHLSPKNIDDMYAKVQKNRRKRDIEPEPGPSGECSIKQPNSTSAADNSNDNDPCRNNNSFVEHNYETLRKSPRKGGDPGYERLKLRENDDSSEPGYDTINGPESIQSSDPGYEVLKHTSEKDIDPNYEELRHQVLGYSNDEDAIQRNDGYSVVNKPPKNTSPEESKSKSSYESDGRDLSTDEPNYESMPSESISEHNYAILKSTGSESDPNYESVHHADPNYESVKYLDVSLEEPPYERLNDDDSSRSESVLNDAMSDIGYERISGLKGKNGDDNIASSSTDPGYETIKKDKQTSNAQSESDCDGIVQV